MHAPNKTCWLPCRASNECYTTVPEDFTIMENAPIRAFSWLRVPTINFIFKTLLRHYAKRFQPGDGRLRDYEPSDGPSFQALDLSNVCHAWLAV